jgi:hypothetical protein
VVDFYAGATDPEAGAPASVLSGPRTFFSKADRYFHFTNKEIVPNELRQQRPMSRLTEAVLGRFLNRFADSRMYKNHVRQIFG